MATCPDGVRNSLTVQQILMREDRDLGGAPVMRFFSYDIPKRAKAVSKLAVGITHCEANRPSWSVQRPIRSLFRGSSPRCELSSPFSPNSDPEMIGMVAIATWSVASIWVKPSRR
jgi:hypothetical protein